MTRKTSEYCREPRDTELGGGGGGGLGVVYYNHTRARRCDFANHACFYNNLLSLCAGRAIWFNIGMLRLSYVFMQEEVGLKSTLEPYQNHLIPHFKPGKICYKEGPRP